ncbi:MAG TPA: anti-sigma factor [Pyrinomonadaceae bacterium]|nr:anti-sigma factor [Pyrinomonadaceae bacterium]
MSEEEKDRVLDLLIDKYVYGLNEEESLELVEAGYELDEAESIEQTVATLCLAGLDSSSEMPPELYSKLLKQGHEIADSAPARPEEVQPVREIVLSGGRSTWFGWLGWATAAAASVALAVSLFVPRETVPRADVPPPASPTPELQVVPAQQRQALIASIAGLVTAEWGKGNVAELASVSGDVVWSDEKQEGYMRFRGLPRNDGRKETYQLWIFDETQDPKTPVDGGTFDVTDDGEVVIPINAKLRVRNPSAFAVTIEKPGGVVVSKREKIATLAPVKPGQA